MHPFVRYISKLPTYSKCQTSSLVTQIPRSVHLNSLSLHRRCIATIIDGKKVSDSLQSEIKTKVAQLKQKYHVVPQIGVILVGSDKSSHTYVNLKKKAAERAGMKVHVQHYPKDVDESTLLADIQKMNQNSHIHGIIVQLPLPPHIPKGKIIEAVDSSKDIDGITSLNMGSVALGKNRSLIQKLPTEEDQLVNFSPCTPLGIIELLDRSNISLEGKHVVILGRSVTVGLPLGLMCLHRNATVTFCHSKTPQSQDHPIPDEDRLPQLVKLGDVIISAVGKPHLVRKEWIKEGAIVIDVGINTISDPSSTKGTRIVGDVDFEGIKNVASAITPVPGGVGPMTVSMVLRNTYESALRACTNKS